jgi:hypothetical protein
MIVALALADDATGRMPRALRKMEIRDGRFFRHPGLSEFLTILAVPT